MGLFEPWMSDVNRGNLFNCIHLYSFLKFPFSELDSHLLH